jgi:hypothetical protein
MAQQTPIHYAVDLKSIPVSTYYMQRLNMNCLFILSVTKKFCLLLAITGQVQQLTVEEVKQRVIFMTVPSNLMEIA